MYPFTFLAHVHSASWLYGLYLQPRGLTGSQHLQNYALISGTVRSQGNKTKAIASQKSHFDMLSKELFLRIFAIWRKAVSYILEGKRRKKEKLTDISVTVFLLPGRVAIGASVKEQIMRQMGMEGNWQVLCLFFCCTRFIKTIEKLKKYNYLVLRLIPKHKEDKMNSNVRENIIHCYHSSRFLLFFFFYNNLGFF